VTVFWQRTPVVNQPSFHWTEAPHYLLPAPEKFGAAFREFMQTNRLPERPLNFKPAPQLSELVIAYQDLLPQKTTLQVSGDLAQRRRLNQIELPSISVNDVIAPSKVQALVDPAGNVASTVLLESSMSATADQRALQLARNLRFAPASRLMFGEIIFTWHTVPVASTNEPTR
jgi:TonB family protein